MPSLKKFVIPINIFLFNICRLIPFRDNHLWIFGALEGKKYDDNSRYMYEYMRKVHQDYRSVWLTNNISTLRSLRSNGKEAYLNGSLRGKWMQIRAGVAFYTHGLMDFGYFPLLGGAEIVALWHGMGFKKIYNGKYSGVKLILKKALDHLFSWTYRTITPVTSVYSADWVQRMFTLNPQNIFITGQPRNDVFKEVDRSGFLKGLGIDTTKRVVIYMPTYRQTIMGTDAIERIVKALYESVTFRSVLKESNSLFLVKLHPLSPQICLPERDDFRVLNYFEVTDNQRLMSACDMLVTDYSSCYVDYALLLRPIIFYLPDEKDFYEKSEKLDEGFIEIAHTNCAVTIDELARCILNPSMAAVDAINEVFEDASIRGTSYSENVFNIVKHKTYA